MTDGFSGTRQRSSLSALRALLAAHAAKRSQIDQRLEESLRRARDTRDVERTRASSARQNALSNAENDATQRRITITGEMNASLERTDAWLESKRSKVTERAGALRTRAEERLRESSWMADTLREAARDRARKHLETDRARLREAIASMREGEGFAARALKRVGRSAPHSGPIAPEGLPSGAAGQAASEAVLNESVERVRSIAASFGRGLAPRLFLGPGPIALGAGLLLAGGLGGAGWSITTAGPMVTGLGAGLGGAAAVSVVVLGMGRVLTGRSVARREKALAEALGRGLGASAYAESCAEDAAEELVQADLARAEADHAQTEQRQRAKLAEAKAMEDEHLPALDEEAERRRTTARELAERAWAQAERDAETRRAQIMAADESACTETERAFEIATRDANEAASRERTALHNEWAAESARIGAVIDASGAWLGRFGTPFDDDSWRRWSPSDASSGMAMFGRLRVDPTALPGGLPTEGTPETLRRTHEVPAAVDLASTPALVITAGPGERERAIETLRTTVLRTLTSIPAGKVRLTLIDPVGLGQNFAAFMHLADHDPQLVSDRIWTEPRHIEQKLADLTEHMETVIQKYLRNEFATIADYNERAGEIAEPYRFLVITDFPAGFTDVSAKRLASIVATGARCGVHTLIHADPRKDLPTGFDLGDLKREAERVTIRTDGVAEWDDPAYAGLALELETLPDEAVVTRILGEVGEGAKRAGRVEVPFATISPTPGEEWSRSCDDELRVPLGRSGATKLQELSLGRGTAQHALVSGKTGSGKSTLLHVLITNLALWYSPDEVEFYLIDFKKGVEFKAYTNGKVPHARAVAIESDREFGLSVIAEVDQELKRRGELYRELGVQNLAGYRRALRERAGTPDAGRFPKLPRTLVIIDEFQEIFTEDDKISQEASLLLDRLVRQGRAFGIHVLMGSQTLAGAYSVARSTLGQMAVRVALQCSEADSYIILHEDNAAARLLSRPGEAIYNDGGGLVEHNSPFQVCWLSDQERDDAHDRVRRVADAAHEDGRGLVVFEGNAPARLEDNRELRRAEATLAEQTAPPRAAHAYLGEPVAIKPPTSAVFRRQHGSNLMIVGQREEPSLALAAAAILSLAGQIAPPFARFVVIDSTPPDDPAAGTLERLLGVLPHETSVVGPREAEGVVLNLGEELARREAADATGSEPSVFLVISGAHRVRGLRRSEDDYSFSMDDEPAAPKPDKVLASLVREGPPLGIHTIITCDTAPNAERLFDRQTMREFESRVLFQMNATDSSTLIDSPEASRLGMHRALLASEESGTIERFRPYEVPTITTVP